jgi:VCBS repeat-containing protein
MYKWSQLGINEITNLYLYGATTKPQDLTSEALIRANGYTRPVQLDAVSFMENGPGRFANGVTISVVKDFMEGKVYAPNGSKQTFSLATVTALLGPLSANVGIAQSSYQDTTDDHASRTYIYQSSPYKLAQGATFVIEADGTRHIQDFAILPLDDDFDFKSKALLSQFGNQYLEPRIDPTGIGRIVTLEFDQTSKTQVPRVDYTSASYASDSGRYQQTFSPITGTAQLAIEMPQVVADLWTQGVTQIVDQQGRLVLHGTNGADSLSPAKFDNVMLYAPLRTALNQNGIALIGGDGVDSLNGLLRNDYLDGGAGNDSLTGGKGDDILIGGAGDDLYIYNTGDGNDRIIETRETDGKIHGRIQINGGAATSLSAAGLFIKHAGQQTWVATNGSQMSLTRNSPWTVHLADGASIDLGEDFQSGDFGINLYEETATAPTTTNLSYTGDFSDPYNIPAINLYDSSGNDSVTAGGGNDWIRVHNGGSDRLDGGAGNDVITDQRGGDDTLTGGAGLDILYSNEGKDKLYADAEVTLNASLAAQNDTGTGLKGEYLDGGADDDLLVGSPGNDALMGGRGNDLMVAGAGDDDIRGDSETDLDWAGSDWSVTRTTTGANGVGSYSAVYHNVAFVPTTEGGWTATSGGAMDSVTYTGIGAQDTKGDDIILAGAGTDWVYGEYGNDYIDGGAGDDVLFGQDGSDQILGGDGNDVMAGDAGATPLALPGDDYLDGGAGDDKLYGGVGNDQLFGGAGNDTLDGEEGNDYLDGGDGNDALNGGALDDELFSGAGDDVLQGDSGTELADGNDYLDGEEGDDTLFGLGGDDRLLGGAGNDQMAGGSGSDDMYGGDGADQMVGDDGGANVSGSADTLYGEAGNDVMEGQGGDDVMDGGADNDLLIGGAGNDQLAGGIGDDQLQGGEGNDALDGGDGSNSLLGQDGNDAIQGGAGNDYLLGGLGDDNLAGGEGDDVYYYTRGDGIDRITDSGGNDRLVLTNITWQELVLGTGSLKLSFTGGEIHLDDFDPDNPFAAGGIEYFQFSGGEVMTRSQLINALGMHPTGTAGADTLTGTALSETIQALGGDDVVTARAGDDVVLGGDGNDVLMGDAGNDTLYGDAGNDLLAGGAGNDVLLGGDGDDTYLFQAGDGQDAATDVLGQNQIVLGAGLTLASITFNKSDNDLLVAINGSTDRLTVKDWFATDSHFTSVTLGDGSVLDRTAVQAALPSNQAPLAIDDSASVSEDMVFTATGNVLSNDSDPEGRALRVTNPGSYAGAVGTLTLNDTGIYSYALNNGAIGVQSLASGQSLTEHFAYAVSDDAPTDPATSSSQISVVVTGRNDAPVVATALADQSITANAMWNWTLPANSLTDIDSADALTYSAMRANGTVLPSWLSFNAAAQSFSGLVPDSASGSMDIQVISSDRLGESASDVFKLTFAPRNQAPLTLADKARVAEDAMVTAAGNVLANDSDLEGRTLRVTNPGSYVGTYGTMTLNSNGSYSYSLNNDSIAVQSLSGDPYTYRLGDWYYVASGTEWVLDHSGDQTVRIPRATDRFVYTVSDDDPRGALASQSEISVAVWGREDIPVAVADFGSTVEDGSEISGNVLANDYDVDAYATLDVLDNYTHTYTGNYGALTMFGPADSLHARGEWSYSLNNASSAVQSLAAGQTVVDNFGYQIVDSSGSSFRSTDDPLWIPSSLSIVIAGLNDAPALKAALADQTASTNSSWSWVLPAGSFSDVDSGDVLTYRATLADSTALPSWLTFNAVTQSFIGTVPSTATGSVNIQVAATDRAGTSASDVFTLAFGKSTGGGVGGNGGGNNGVGSKGNEGVGNGVDAPPPGQTVSFNDGLGTSPGNPGAKGGVTTKATGINELSGTTSALQTPSAPSVDLSTVPSYLGINDWAKYSTSPGAASVGGADAASVFARWLAMDLAVSSALANAAGGRLGVAAGGENLSLLNQTGNGFLGSTTSFGKDTLSLLAASGNSLNTFRGLGNGVQNIA